MTDGLDDLPRNPTCRHELAAHHAQVLLGQLLTTLAEAIQIGAGVSEQALLFLRDPEQLPSLGVEGCGLLRHGCGLDVHALDRRMRDVRLIGVEVGQQGIELGALGGDRLATASIRPSSWNRAGLGLVHCTSRSSPRRSSVPTPSSFSAPSAHSAASAASGLGNGSSRHSASTSST